VALLKGIVRHFLHWWNTAKKPTGIFFMDANSRGNSVFKSRWINNDLAPYGRNMFLA
jgi:hypothetical protein